MVRKLVENQITKNEDIRNPITEKSWYKKSRYKKRYKNMIQNSVCKKIMVQKSWYKKHDKNHGTKNHGSEIMAQNSEYKNSTQKIKVQKIHGTEIMLQKIRIQKKSKKATKKSTCVQVTSKLSMYKSQQHKRDLMTCEEIAESPLKFLKKYYNNHMELRKQQTVH